MNFSANNPLLRQAANRYQQFYMKQRILNILWFLISVNTFLFWFLIYNTIIAEYGNNFVYLFFAIILSILTLCILIYVALKDNLKTKSKKFIKIFVLVFGTPFSVFFLWIYMSYLHTNHIYSSLNEKYEMEKSKNYFKAKNVLIDKHTNGNTDTLVAIILKNGSLDRLYKIKNGKSIELTLNEIQYIPKIEKEKFISY